MAMATLNEILNDRDQLCRALGVAAPADAAPCPFCASPATLRIWHANEAVWKWTCSNTACKAHAKNLGTCEATVVDALVLKTNRSRGEVIAELTHVDFTEEPFNPTDDQAPPPQNELPVNEPPSAAPPPKRYSKQEDEEELLQIKSDGSAFSEVLGITKFGNHCPCPACKDKTSMRAGPDGSGSGVYIFQCMKGCGQGTIIDAVMMLQRVKLPEAIQIVKQRYGRGNPNHKPSRAPNVIRKPSRDNADHKERIDPVIDEERASAFVNYAHTELMTREEIQEKWLAKRKISLEVADRFKLGFFEKCSIPQLGKDGGADFTMPAENVWVLPLTDLNNKLMAVKLHFETPPLFFKGKSMWVNYGTVPAHDRHANIKPRCSYNTFWPHVEHQKRQLRTQDIIGIDWWINRMPEDLATKFDTKLQGEKCCMAQDLGKALEDLEPHHLEQARATAFSEMQDEIRAAVKKSGGLVDTNINTPVVDDYVIICGGELKALAAISAGEIATSITGGEASLPNGEQFSCFRGRAVILCLDDDPVKKIETPNGDRLISTGTSFGNNLIAALLRHKAKRVIPFRLGRKD